MAHKLPALRFGYDALEPYIDAETMELHHDKHHQAYVDNLNKALEPYPELADLTAENLLHRLDQVPETIRAAVRATPAATSTISSSGTSSDLTRAGCRGARSPTPSRGTSARSSDSGRCSPRRRRATSARAGRSSSWTPRPAAPRDRVAAQPGQRAGPRDAGAPLLRCLGARLLLEVQEPPPGLPQRLVERRRLGRGGRAVPRRHGGGVPAVVRAGDP